MNIYKVKYTIYSGGYEKGVTTVIEAPDEYIAGSCALILECHGEPDFDDETHCEDGTGEFRYSVWGVERVPAKYYAAVKAVFKPPIFESVEECLDIYFGEDEDEDE